MKDGNIVSRRRIAIRKANRCINFKQKNKIIFIIQE